MVRVDEEGELYSAPPWLTYVWAVLVLLALLEAINELFRIGGPSGLYEVWDHDVVVGAAAVLLLARAVYEPATRKAWLAFGIAFAVWSAGSISWSIVYGSQATVPYPSFADVFWMLWYPFMAAGVVYLIRFRVQGFELHRWLDGIAVILVVLAAGFALVVQPAAHHTHQGLLGTIVSFGYPVLDVLLIGAILGVYGLLGWRPDGMWILIGAGIMMIAAGDAVFAVRAAAGFVNDGRYEFIWSIGALMIAAAAWDQRPAAPGETGRVTGMRAIALALMAQALAIGIQIYAIFHEIGVSERVVTVIVLVVATVQIILTRPRANPPEPAQPAERAPDLPVSPTRE
jgi:hypothetical protein